MVSLRSRPARLKIAPTFPLAPEVVLSPAPTRRYPLSDAGDDLGDSDAQSVGVGFQAAAGLRSIADRAQRQPRGATRRHGPAVIEQRACQAPHTLWRRAVRSHPEGDAADGARARARRADR